MPGPLDGIRIIDVTSMVSGPLATMILADQGADVIKVENPNGGDHTRHVSNHRGGFSATFLNNNRNKRSLALNLKDPRGLDILMRLVAGADVFVQNFRPGVAERIGIGEEAIRKAAREIVYVSINGFGDRGPYAGKPVYDPLVQALSGLTTIQGGSDEQRPRLVRTILPDKLTAITASQAITSALFARERTGTGQHVRLSMLDSIVSFLWSSDMDGQTFVGADAPPQEAQSFIDLIYETADGHVSVAVQSNKEWAGLARAVARPDWLEDPRFATPALRHRNIDARLELTQEALRPLTSQEALERLESEDVPCAPVLRRRDVIEHPQILANETLIETDHPVAGRIRQTRGAARFSASPAKPPRAAPRLGEHSHEVLREIGLTDDELGHLTAERVIATAESGDAA
jgi:crotonobetainyl-CoA:carnitine CoA-transferase CaiB-like acyl-CoA transferase